MNNNSDTRGKNETKLVDTRYTDNLILYSLALILFVIFAIIGFANCNIYNSVNGNIYKYKKD